ncbi:MULTISPECIES: Hsp33 family molecular chaperone HslO [Dehalobacter]|jgi:molecular chaperone Hsp33|uniref:33 kDa chaperonin n=1 Tax=Dehalobacter restrictus TaxID=55583 RepID=A0A857DIL7_9FIRM|nr:MULTISPECIES: Hsp33 family molecular chaperone HslO [Dehalobacter]MCG1025125.1 Hsp33 family molecular chaperone HslO [Dehalobacter sp.]OCZ52479.1 Hsp33 family molecular chaperone [Dehalobacter sp. TeCB1]QHA00643.1 Hsp33 family molecular chaperone HslO [Dehalobacter restrictus]
MNDYLVKALGYDGKVRAYAALTTETVGEAQRRHQTWPTASAALGRTLTAGLMLGAMLKGDEQLTVKIEGNGPLGIILVDANAYGEVRGYVTNPQTHLDLNRIGKLDVSGAVGSEGTLSVVKDLGMRDYFTGQVPLYSGEIGEDFTYYLVKSEQIPSSVGLGVLVAPDHTIQASGGFIIQLLPGTAEETISEIEEHLKTITPVSTMIQHGFTPEEMLEEILGKNNVQVLAKMPVKFQCQCSKERIGNAMISLGKEEIEEIIQTDGQAEAQCHFCNETYLFSREGLETLKDATR